jgi:hypothetical protein
MTDNCCNCFSTTSLRCTASKTNLMAVGLANAWSSRRCGSLFISTPPPRARIQSMARTARLLVAHLRHRCFATTTTLSSSSMIGENDNSRSKTATEEFLLASSTKHAAEMKCLCEYKKFSLSTDEMFKSVISRFYRMRHTPSSGFVPAVSLAAELPALSYDFIFDLLADIS